MNKLSDNMGGFYGLYILDGKYNFLEFDQDVDELVVCG